MAGTGTAAVRQLLRKTVLDARALAGLGPAAFAAIVSTSVRSERDRRREVRDQRRPSLARGPGRLRHCQPTEGTAGVRCSFEEAELEVRFLADDVARITWSSGEVAPPAAWAPPDRLALEGRVGPVEVASSADGCVADGARLRVRVSSQGELRVVDRLGAVVRHELPPLRRSATRVARVLLRPGERVCGLGEHASRLDVRGTRHRLWNRDPGGSWGPGDDPLYCTVPVVVGLHPEADVLAYYHTSFEATVDLPEHRPALGSSPIAEVSLAGGPLSYYLVVGRLPGLLARYGQLTGLPPLPPRWALGYHQSRWGYRTKDHVRSVVEGFVADGLPLSALYLDIDHLDRYRMFTVDRARFGDLEGLVTELAAAGVRLVPILDPAITADPACDSYVEGRRDRHFVEDGRGRPFVGSAWSGRAVFPDFTNPATRRWWADRYQVLLGAGVAGVWHDMNEPTSIALWGDRTLPRRAAHDLEGRGGNHLECHNVYGLLMDRAGWEALAKARPGRRPFVLSRAGWAGVQRWAWTWTGDIEATWDGLAQQVPTALNLGLSGVAYTGSDVGGFNGAPSPELYLRWLELAVLMPLCRTHSVLGAPAREPWCFPEPVRTAVGRLIRFRYRLLPYLYTSAEATSRCAAPLVRPLCWPDQAVEAERNQGPAAPWSDTVYRLGDALVVVPITRPGAEAGSAPLPAGRWFYWRALPAADSAPGDSAPTSWGGDLVTVVEGGATRAVPAPLGQAGVLVAAGSVLPLDDGWTEAYRPRQGSRRAGPLLDDGHAPRLLSLHCFPDTGGDARGTCYDDAGDGTGPWRRDHFHLETVHQRVRLTWTSEGRYPRPTQVRVVLHGVAARGALVDGAPVVVDVTEAGGLPATILVAPHFDEVRFE